MRNQSPRSTPAAGSRPVSTNAPPRRYEAIVRTLEQSMHGGHLLPGDRLPSERELMARFGAGRGTVREALFALKRMGLVALSPGERAHVIRPTAQGLVGELGGAARALLAAPDGMRHFQHARLLLECALAREAAAHATPEVLLRLARALKANQEARDLPHAIETDIRFHMCIAEMTGNPVLTALHVALGEWLREQRSTSVRDTGARIDANAAHDRIYRAIAARDPDAAADAMRQHLDEVEAHYWKAVEEAAS